MDALMRMTGAVAALGAALIALAVGAASVPWLAVPLLVAGVGQAAVAVLALRGGRLPDPRLHSAAVLTPLLVPTLAWLGALLVAPDAAEGMPLGPMLAETALALTAAALLARPAAARAGAHEPKPLAALLSLVGSAAIVAAVATGALAGTDAGRYAVPHGEHGSQPAPQDEATDDAPQLDESLLDEHDHH